MKDEEARPIFNSFQWHLQMRGQKPHNKSSAKLTVAKKNVNERKTTGC
jgi:hypothetical protein